MCGTATCQSDSSVTVVHEYLRSVHPRRVYSRSKVCQQERGREEGRELSVCGVIPYVLGTRLHVSLDARRVSRGRVEVPEIAKLFPFFSMFLRNVRALNKLPNLCYMS